MIYFGVRIKCIHVEIYILNYSLKVYFYVSLELAVQVSWEWYMKIQCSPTEARKLEVEGMHFARKHHI